jgi:hypothetical protein
MTSRQEEMLVERRVTYALELSGKFYIGENVSARVDEETGEQFFSPSTVDHLQRMILGGRARGPGPTEPLSAAAVGYTADFASKAGMISSS